MLRLFFNRDSLIVYCLEGLGVIGLIAFLASESWWVEWRTFARVGLGLFIAQYLFIRYCGTVKWYPRAHSHADAHKELGIELQFKKALVPTSYLMALTALWLWAGGWPVWLWLMNLLLLIIDHVNVILLYFHFRDKDPMPVNHFSNRSTTSATAVSPAPVPSPLPRD